MNDKSLNNEIDLFDLIVRIYIFLRMKIVFIIIVTIFGVCLGIAKSYYEKNKIENACIAQLKLSSDYLKPSLLLDIFKTMNSKKIEDLGLDKNQIFKQNFINIFE